MLAFKESFFFSVHRDTHIHTRVLISHLFSSGTTHTGIVYIGSRELFMLQNDNYFITRYLCDGGLDPSISSIIRKNVIYRSFLYIHTKYTFYFNDFTYTCSLASISCCKPFFFFFSKVSLHTWECLFLLLLFLNISLIEHK